MPAHAGAAGSGWTWQPGPSRMCAHAGAAPSAIGHTGVVSLPSTLRVAAVQLSAGLDASTNRALVASVVEQSCVSAPDLIVLPEATMHDFGPADLELGAVAEPLDGPFVAAVAAAAADSGAVVVAGMFERRTGPGGVERPYNTVVAMAPDGTMLARYRKLHLYDAFSYQESSRLVAGAEEPPVFEVGGLQVGIMTCYDLRFPEVARLLVDAGAEVILVPAAWVAGEGKVLQWQALLTARAIENTVYVVAAAQSAPRYCGHSTVIDPMGVVLASAGDDDAVITVDLAGAQVRAARATNPSLANRRLTVTRPNGGTPDGDPAAGIDVHPGEDGAAGVPAARWPRGGRAAVDADGVPAARWPRGGRAAVDADGVPTDSRPRAGRAAVDAVDEVEQLLGILRAHGERVTPARRAVIGVLAETAEHLSADDIALRVEQRQPADAAGSGGKGGRKRSGAHRTTVYRALETLHELGIVRHVHLGHGATTYHLADPLHADPHLHAQCGRCGRIEDVSPTLLEQARETLAAERGFALLPTHAALLGLCADCAPGRPHVHAPHRQ